MRYLVIIDPIDELKVNHDTSIALMEAIDKKDQELWYATANDIFASNGRGLVACNRISLELNASPWYHVEAQMTKPLTDFDIILMRKDPPFNMNYIFITYMLDLAANNGVLVANNPQSLRNFNEKLLLNYFPNITTNYLVSSKLGEIKKFHQKYNEIVVKPLDSMGGDSVYKIGPESDNDYLLLRMTEQQQKAIMVMEYIPEVTVGDKRILILNGKPASHALLRTPPEGQLQANIAAGGTGTVMELSENDRKICEQIAPFCLQNGLYFVGVDVIGNYVTEINITSPTCLREISAYTNEDLAMEFIEGLEAQCH